MTTSNVRNTLYNASADLVSLKYADIYCISTTEVSNESVLLFAFSDRKIIK